MRKTCKEQGCRAPVQRDWQYGGAFIYCEQHMRAHIWDIREHARGKYLAQFPGDMGGAAWAGTAAHEKFLEQARQR